MTRCWLATALLCGCAGDGTGDTGTSLTQCQGAGEPTVELGGGGLEEFVPWEEGATVTIVDQGGTYGFEVELLTTGIDTTAPVTTFLRFTVGGDTTSQDVGATLTFQCPNEGPGWYGVFAPLDEAYQDPLAVGGIDGFAMTLDVVVTDQAGDNAEDDLDLVIDAP